MDWLTTWLDKAQYGTVPAYFGGASLLLAFILFYRDRRRDDREQIDKVAVWVIPDWDRAFHGSDRKVEPTEEVRYRVSAKNSNDIPIEIAQTAFTIETSWWVLSGPLSLQSVAGTEPCRLFQDSYLLPPGEQREQPEQPHYVGHRAPVGATQLDPLAGARCQVQWILAIDNAGRRWEVRPGQGKRARRIRWYSHGRPYYPVAWKNRITYPLRVRFFRCRDWIHHRWKSKTRFRTGR